MYKMCNYWVMSASAIEKGILNRNTNEFMLIKTWILE